MDRPQDGRHDVWPPVLHRQGCKIRIGDGREQLRLHNEQRRHRKGARRRNSQVCGASQGKLVRQPWPFRHRQRPVRDPYEICCREGCLFCRNAANHVEDGTDGRQVKYDYFLKGSNSFFTNHRSFHFRMN